MPFGKCAFYWGVASVWPLCHKGLSGGVLQRWVSFSTEEIWNRALSVYIRFLVTYLTKAILPRLLSLAGRPALGRVLVVLNFFPFKNDGGHYVLGDIQCCRMYYSILPQICASTQSGLWALRTIPLTSWLGFCSDSTVNCETLYGHVCLSNHVQSIEFTTGAQIKL